MHSCLLRKSVARTNVRDILKEHPRSALWLPWLWCFSWQLMALRCWCCHAVLKTHQPHSYPSLLSLSARPRLTTQIHTPLGQTVRTHLLPIHLNKLHLLKSPDWSSRCQQSSNQGVAQSPSHCALLLLRFCPFVPTNGLALWQAGKQLPRCLSYIFQTSLSWTAWLILSPSGNIQNLARRVLGLISASEVAYRPHD